MLDWHLACTYLLHEQIDTDQAIRSDQSNPPNMVCADSQCVQTRFMQTIVKLLREKEITML